MAGSKTAFIAWLMSYRLFGMRPRALRRSGGVGDNEMGRWMSVITEVGELGLEDIFVGVGSGGGT